MPRPIFSRAIAATVGAAVLALALAFPGGPKPVVVLSGGWAATVPAGSTYRRPLVVRATRAGRPVAGVLVLFQLSQGVGPGPTFANVPVKDTFSVAVATDAAGVATSPPVVATSWGPGATARVTATAHGLSSVVTWRLGTSGPA